MIENVPVAGRSLSRSAGVHAINAAAGTRVRILMMDDHHSRFEMDEQQTCGKGLAQHSALTASLGDLVASTARVLEVHMKALDLTDENAKREYDAYRELASAHRRIAGELAGYRTLPMGRHDMTVMMSAPPRHAFAGFVKQEEALVALLETRLSQDRAMLAAMAAAGDAG
jgi:hypothetical protein